MMVEALTYANKPRRRRWSAKWLVIAGLTTAALAGWRWWPVLWQRAELWVAGVRVSHVRLPSDALAIDDYGNVLLAIPRQWSDFHDTYEGGLSFQEATLFLAERTAPNGTRRLIEVGCFGNSPAYQMDPRNAMSWETFQFSRLRLIVDSQQQLHASNGKVKPNGLAFFTGAADPIDASHFTIRCHVNGTQKYIDGYLLNDGRVQFDLRPSSLSGCPAGAPVGRMHDFKVHSPEAPSPHGGS